MINETSSLQKNIRLKSKYSLDYKNEESISTKKNNCYFTINNISNE